MKKYHINRSIGSICNKAYDLKLTQRVVNGVKITKKKLSLEQITFIKDNYMKYTDIELAYRFNVGINAIADVCKKFGITKNGNEVKGPTYIEKIVMDILDEMKIPYVYNEYLGEYKPDFVLGKTIIEVQGDYFHCNPYLYPEGPKDDIQVKHVLRDYRKKCYYLSRGYHILELWEKDINENISLIREQIATAVCSQSLQKTAND